MIIAQIHMMKLAVLFLAGLAYTQAAYTKLPDDFFVGFATASYQVEGAWNEDGKFRTEFRNRDQDTEAGLG